MKNIRTFTSTNGVEISIGKNAIANDFLCKNSEPDEYWLHLQCDSSPHAIVHNHIEDENDLLEAAQLVKKYSKLKHKNKVKVSYCQVQFIKTTKSIGQVILLTEPKCLCV